MSPTGRLAMGSSQSLTRQPGERVRECHWGSDLIQVLARSLTSHVTSRYPAQGRGHPQRRHHRLLPDPTPDIPGWAPCLASLQLSVVLRGMSSSRWM